MASCQTLANRLVTTTSTRNIKVIDMDKNKKFIIAVRDEVAEELIKLGYQLFTKHGNTFFFVNAPNKNSDVELHDIVYTDSVFL